LIDAVSEVQSGQEAIDCMRMKRVAWLGDMNRYLAMQEGVLECCESALMAFSRMGARLEIQN
jgi:amidase